MNYIFISYINRSGSTFLVNQFSKIDLFCTCPEADVLYDILLRDPDNNKPLTKKRINTILKDNKFIPWKLIPNEVEEILISKDSNSTKFLSILHLFRASYFPSGKYIIFKHNFILHLKSYFENNHPSQTFYWINLYRDPFAIYASQKQTISPHTGRRMAINVVLFCQQVLKMESIFNQTKAENCIKMDFSEIVLNFNKSFNTIFNFLNVKIDTQKLLSVPGKINQFMSQQYKELHPAIDFHPIKQGLDRDVNSLTDFEKYYIAHKIPTWIHGNRRNCEQSFKLQYIFLIIEDWIGAFYYNTKKRLRTMINRN